MKRIEIFRPGKHTAMNGAVTDFTEADLAASAAAYDPAKHEAPLVVGHPRHDAPAYGWAKSLDYVDRVLAAGPDQVDTAFAEMVAAGRFKKISASFYTPDSPSNPVPGVYYLRHIGFLGAQPPAVKGLRTPEFADSEEGVIEFADWSDMQNASMWRRLRDFFIAQFGLEKADNVIPDYAVASLEDEARKDETPPAAPAFSEPQPKGDEMSAEDKARLAELETENAALKTKQVEFAENEKKRVSAARHAEHVAFAEAMITAGKLLPVAKASSVALMDCLAAQESVIEFGEGDGKKTSTPLALYKAQLEALPKAVEFGEMAGGKGAVGDGEMEASTLAAKAVEFQESEGRAGRNITTAQAVQHIQRTRGEQ